MKDFNGIELGNYKLFKLLGRGGFAEVWLGTHLYLHTEAAVKILLESSLDIDDFQREAQIIKNLTHPNIIEILDFGIERNINIPYLIMEYAPYGTLRQRHPKGLAISPPTIIPYVNQISIALQHAHNNGVIHRDVKPENMLLGHQNRVLLSDFGIAISTPSRRSPNTRDIAGTRAYMPPEQVNGLPVRQSDQYSLAVVVYEWLTGHRPPKHLATGIASTEDVQWSKVSPEVRAVVMQALASDPEDRFENVRDFADALREAISGPSPQRVVSYAAGTTLYTYKEHTDWICALAWLSDDQRIASAGADKTIQTWDVATGGYVVKYRDHSRRVAGLALSPNGQYLSSASWDRTVQVRELATGLLVGTFPDHKKQVNTVSWSPDNKRFVSGGDDRQARIWDITIPGLVSLYQGHTGQVNAVSWSANGDKVASGSHDKTVQIWNPDSSQRLLRYKGHTGWVLAVAWSPDSKLVASGGSDNTVQIWDARTGKLVLQPIKHVRPILSVAWSPDGKKIVFGSLDRVEVWDFWEEKRSFSYTSHKGWVRAVAWSPDGRKIASGGDEGIVQIWSIG